MASELELNIHSFGPNERSKEILVLNGRYAVVGDFSAACERKNLWSGGQFRQHNFVSAIWMALMFIGVVTLASFDVFGRGRSLKIW